MAERTRANGNSRKLSACQRRAAVERTWHPAPRAASAVRHLCGGSTNRQPAFLDRNASHGRTRSEIHWPRRCGPGRGSGACRGPASGTQRPLCCEATFEIARPRHAGCAAWGRGGYIRRCPRSAEGGYGASELLQDVFGKAKNPSRLVYGVASLPLGTPVELELIYEIS